MKFIIVTTILLSPLLLNAQVPNNSKLVLSEIMKGNEFVGFQPENIRWSVDSKFILFDWNPEKNPGNSTYIYSLETKKYQKATLELLNLLVENDPLQFGHKSYYYIIDGVLVRYELASKNITVIYKTTQFIHSIQRIPLNENVYFVSINNLFVYSETSKGIEQITNFIQEEKPENTTDSTFLEKQQTALFQYINDKNKRIEWRNKNEIQRFKYPKEIYIGKDNIDNIQISKNGQFIYYRISKEIHETETQFDNFITNNGYVKTSKARSKVTLLEPNYKLGIVNLLRDTTYFVNFSKLSNIRKKPNYLNDKSDYQNDRNIIIHRVVNSNNGKYALIDIRSSDNKDRWIVQFNNLNGEILEIENQHDEAWIGGPGIHEWGEEEGVLGFLPDNETFYYQSEITGYSHLYTFNLNSKIKTALTAGNWEVHKVKLSNDGKRFYITANKNHPGNREFYHLSISDQKLTPILTKEGAVEVEISTDEKYLAVRFSTKNNPWELYLCKNEKNNELIQITQSQTEKFKNYQWKSPEVIKIQGSDGKEFYARIYKPTNETKNNATVMFVHGAGYLQNAHNYWSYYCREYMFHNMLTDNGYTVIDIDYRASEGYGRDYRTAIYENMGGRDLADYIDAKKYLVKNYHLDSNRFGIYGGSYGGFITLMGMLKTPGQFVCGAALRSVTDWAHYNLDYTSNILNYPETDPKAYERSSPIYYANNLKGRLLLLHGMVDDNVQFQDVVRLSQRFIELGKTNWELAVFPVEAHSFKESYSWTDEYRRIYEMFYEELGRLKD
ncbi:MAG: S9 family peptidase [Flavobacteriia bacterium]|nr:S9 family peptidase [Flavobacteriia bacterium]